MRLGIKILHLHLTVTYVAETYFDPLFAPIVHAISHYFEQLVGLLIVIGWLKNRSEEIIMN